ncbi:MAG: 50S ribosomal protein L6 [candidate division WOR-3 bacterium]
MARSLKPISIPSGITVSQANRSLVFQGRLGKLSVDMPPRTDARVTSDSIMVEGADEDASRFVGLARALIRNALHGVTEGYTKTLEIRGMGFRAQKTKDGKTQLLVGYSHPVNIEAPEGITIDLSTIPNPDDPKTQITEVTIKGTDRWAVGELASNIRRLRPPDPYHGKGIRYRGEYVRKKAGKRAVGGQQ